MSATTIDLEFRRPAFPPAGATSRLKSEWDENDLRALRRPSSAHPGASLLWAFDEARESARFKAIQTRILRLEAALFEEFGSRITPGSRQCVERLFVTCPTIRTPSISAQPDGFLVCTWSNAAGERLTIRCAGRETLHYAILSRDAVSGQLSNRQWGAFSRPAMFWNENPLARRIAE